MTTPIQEIERRFLLRERPITRWDHVYNITQYYIPDGDVIRRLRSQIELTEPKNGESEIKFEYLYKKPQGNPGEFIEYHDKDMGNICCLHLDFIKFRLVKEGKMNYDDSDAFGHPLNEQV